VLSLDVAIQDLDTRHLSNWFELLLPPGMLNDIFTDPKWAILWRKDGIVTGGIVGGQPLETHEIPLSGVDNQGLRSFCEKLEVGAVLVLEEGVISSILGDIESSLSLDQDYAEQGLLIWNVIKGYHRKGISFYPPLLDLLPKVSFESLQKTFDLLIPNDSTLCAYVFEDDGSDIYASVIAVKKAGNFDFICTHQAVSDAVNSQKLAKKWKSNYKDLNRAIGKRFFKPSVSVFLSKAAFYRMLSGPGDLTRELGDKNIIIDPAPAWLLGLLSGAMVTAYASKGAKAIARFLPSSARKIANDLASGAQDVLKEKAPFGLLGFDPIQLWKTLRKYYQPRP